MPTTQDDKRPARRRRPVRALEAGAVALLYGFVAFVALGLVVPRFLPTDGTDPWPLGATLYALLLIHLPMATGALVLWSSRGHGALRRGVTHAAAVTALCALYLGGVLI